MSEPDFKVPEVRELYFRIVTLEKGIEDIKKTIKEIQDCIVRVEWEEEGEDKID